MSEPPEAPQIVGIGNFAAADVAALAKMQNYQSQALARTQQKAEKWLPGLTAITAILTTAVVIKGPEGFTELAETRDILGLSINPTHWIIGAMVLGAVLLGIATFCAYSAAFGNPMRSQALQALALKQQIEDAYAQWTAAVSKVAKRAGKFLSAALILTVLGVLALLTAIFLTWTTPERVASASDTCIQVGAEKVRIAGSPPSVKEGTLSVVAC